MNKKSMSVATLGVISTALLGCSNQVQTAQVIPNQTGQVSISSDKGLNNFVSSMTEIYFSMLDKNKNGSVTLEEYIANMYGDKIEEAKLAFKKLDKDNDGKIILEDVKKSYKIFFAPFNITSKEQIRNFAKASFNRADINKDTFINESEFVTYMNNEFSFLLNNGNSLTGVALTSYMFESSDKTKDKKLTFSEFEDFSYNFLVGLIKACSLGTGSSTTYPTTPPSPEDPYPSYEPPSYGSK